MLPLTDGAGYKLFSALNVFAYRWCDYKLFGMNILSPPSWWGFLLRRFMKIQSGFYYHIKDTFFEEIQDSTLMSNKEDGNYRPHYLAIQDTQHPEIFWMVPVSSKYAKYQKIYNHQIEKYKV